MSVAPVPPVDPAFAIRQTLDLQRAAFRAEPMPSLQTRLTRLSRLEAIVLDQREDLVAAIREDFGARMDPERRHHDDS